jgi:hypothetical protein
MPEAEEGAHPGVKKVNINNEMDSFAMNAGELRQKTCFTPACERFRFLFRWVTAVVALGGNAMDILYAYSAVYVSQTIYFATCVLLLIRLVLSIVIAQFYYNKYVKNWKFSMSQYGSNNESRGVQEDRGDDDEGDYEERQDERGRSMSIKDADFINDGKKLYGSNYLMFYLGIFRLMPVKYFSWELGIGYIFDFVICLIPMLMCQLFNNHDTDTDITVLQSIAMFVKLLGFFLFFIEITLFIWEALQYKQMREL